MKKRLAVLLVSCVFFFGSIGITSAITDGGVNFWNDGVSQWMYNTPSGNANNAPTNDSKGIGAAAEAKGDSSPTNYGSSKDSFWPAAKDALTPDGMKNADSKDWAAAKDTPKDWTAKDAQKTDSAVTPKPPSGGPDDMTSTDFLLDPNNLSPSEKKYKQGTRTNFKNILANIGKYLLITVTTIAVLSIVVGGLMISTTGPTDRAAKGKTIIMLNITAIIVALLSYSIIKFVSWIIA